MEILMGNYLKKWESKPVGEIAHCYRGTVGTKWWRDLSVTNVIAFLPWGNQHIV